MIMINKKTQQRVVALILNSLIEIHTRRKFIYIDFLHIFFLRMFPKYQFPAYL